MTPMTANTTKAAVNVAAAANFFRNANVLTLPKVPKEKQAA